jgi:hypothetical protein
MEIFPSNFFSSSIHMRALQSSVKVVHASSADVEPSYHCLALALCRASKRRVCIQKHTTRRPILSAKRARHFLIKYDTAATHFSAIRRPGSINIGMNATARSGIQRGLFVVMSVQAKSGLRDVEQHRRCTVERIVWSQVNKSRLIDGRVWSNRKRSTCFPLFQV